MGVLLSLKSLTFKEVGHEGMSNLSKKGCIWYFLASGPNKSRSFPRRIEISRRFIDANQCHRGFTKHPRCVQTPGISDRESRA